MDNNRHTKLDEIIRKTKESMPDHPCKQNSPKNRSISVRQDLGTEHRPKEEAPLVSKRNRQEELSEKESPQMFGVLTCEEQSRISERMLKDENKKSKTTSSKLVQVKGRMTAAEKEIFDARRKTMGLNQSDYIKRCTLYEQIVIQTITSVDVETLNALMEITAELGRVGGLLKGIAMTDKGEFRHLGVKEKQALETQIRDLNRLKNRILNVTEQIYGNS